MAAEDIVILGAGPAAAATAIGLARLGEPVTLIGSVRRIPAVEGVSARVVEALHGLGLNRALQQLSPPSPRRANWNGIASEANSESLVDRQRFDRALLEDLEHLGIRVLHGHVSGLRSDPAGHHIEFTANRTTHTLKAGFIVEARGRMAPAGSQARVRGAETLSILQHWQGPPGAAHSAIQSLEDGWAWMAALADGRRYLQLTLDAHHARLPAKHTLAAYCTERFRAITAARPFVEHATPVGEPHARTSTAILNTALVGDNWLRVGDAAMAVDPLSGSGIFQALSSALQAPAVIATLRHAPEQAALARQFHHQRIEHLFYRFARIGRDFYAEEARWRSQPFWAGRRQWPDRLPLHTQMETGSAYIAQRPVVQNGRIVEAEVVITPDQPLGVWHMNGIHLAPLLRLALETADCETVETRLQKKAGLDAAQAQAISHWMRAQQWIA